MILQQQITTSKKWHIARVVSLTTYCGGWVANETETTSENDLMPDEYICQECLREYETEKINKHTKNGRLVF